jgi:hypothetical protein
MSPTLKDGLSEWVGVEGAEHLLSQCLGLMGPEVRYAVEAKHVYWSANPVGSALHDILMRLVEIGVLEYRDEPDYEVRWNQDFRGSWEANLN